jgi:hypothetical protein
MCEMPHRVFYWDRETNRVWIAGQRIHHGSLGAALFGASLVLMAHDRADRREWFKRARLTLSS